MSVLAAAVAAAALAVLSAGLGSEPPSAPPSAVVPEARSGSSRAVNATPDPAADSVPEAGPTTREGFRPPFDRNRHSTSDPASPWVVVNKRRPVPPGFRPDLGLVRGYQVARPAVAALQRLLDDGDARGLDLKIASAFRSYAYQERVHASTVAARGREAAEGVSARPGHSEHQTGLAVDLVTLTGDGCALEACFADTAAGRWLAQRAWRYGFVVRYQATSTAITGYAPEPWHLRYVGRALAAELRRTGTATLEEFFGVTGGDYR